MVKNAVVIDDNLHVSTSINGQQLRYCAMPNLLIPDMGMGILTNHISVPDKGNILDLDVYLNILHTYVGDLKVTLEQTSNTAPITLIDRIGCSGSNIDVTINDEGSDGTIGSKCADAPAIYGNRIGGNPPGSVLSIFDNEDISGDWTITVSDTSRGDVGTLVEWCLIPTIPATTGRIEIIQDTVPNSPQDFTFTVLDGLASSFVLDDDADGTLSNFQDYEDVEAGTYIVSQIVPSGYTSSVSCIDPSDDSIQSNDITRANATINLAVQETVRCTFVSNLGCMAGMLIMSGSDAHSGLAGYPKNFTVNGVNVHVSGWSRDKATDIYAPAYVGAYPNGVGVTDLVSDGNGSNNQHALDNNGADNYLLFEFDRPVIINQFHLGYKTANSDIMVWIGNAPSGVDPYSNHQTLNGVFLNGLIAEPYPSTSSTWVNINGGNQSGNILVVAPKIGDSNDYFKVDKLDITCPN